MSVLLIGTLDTKGVEYGFVRDLLTRRGVPTIATGPPPPGPLNGVLGLRGSAGTTIGTSAMRALPFGVPKVMVSTLASGNTAPYVGTRDVTMMYSVVDIAGLNRVSRQVIRNAGGAVCGMVRARERTGAEADKPL